MTVLRWFGGSVAATIEAAAGKGVRKAARAVLALSRPRVPIDTGKMRASGRTFTVDHLTAGVGYLRPGPKGDVITRRQHEDLLLNHPRGGEAKWLERTLRDYRANAIYDVGVAVRRVVGGGPR